MKYQINSLDDFDLMVERMRAGYIAGHDLTYSVQPKTRTNQQRKAIEVYCRLLSDGLNDAGLDMQKTLATAASIPWAQPRVKESIWRPIQIAMFDKKSTTALDTSEVSKVYEVANRHMGENHGVSMPFPHYDGLNCK